MKIKCYDNIGIDITIEISLVINRTLLVSNWLDDLIDKIAK